MSNAALDRATSLRSNANLRAIFEVIADGESRHDETAWRLANVGGVRNDLSPIVHPWYGRSTTEVGHSTAFGKFQFLGTSAKEACDALGLDGSRDFGPIVQELCAIWTIDVKRHALAEVMSGNILAACAKLDDEWVALKTMGAERVKRVFLAYGGTLAGGVPQSPSSESMPQAPLTAPPQITDTTETSPMGLELIFALLPSVLSLFAPRAQAQVQKITQQPPEVAEAFVKDLFQKIGQVVNQPKPLENPVAAVAALQQAAKTTPEAVKEVESHALDYLDKIAPMIDKLMQTDAAANAAMIAGRNAAMIRQQADTTGTVPIVVRNVNGQSWMVLGGLVVALLGTAVAKGYWPEMPDYFTVVLALAGPLFGQVMKERGAIIAYYFDGTPSSNAANALNQQIIAATPKERQ